MILNLCNEPANYNQKLKIKKMKNEILICNLKVIKRIISRYLCCHLKHWNS